MDNKILFGIIGIAFVGGMFTVAFAGPMLPTITLAGNTQTTGDADIDGNLNVDGTLTADIADGTITRNDLSQDGCGNNQILQWNGAAWICADRTITSAEIADNAVGPSEIAANAVGQSEIAANAVGSSEIADGSVDPSKLKPTSASDPGPVGSAIGVPYSINCPTGSLAVGIHGRIAAALDDIQLVCREIERGTVGPIGPVFSFTKSFSNTVTGSSGGSFFELECDKFSTNFFMTGMTVYQNPNPPSNVHDITLHCIQIPIDFEYTKGPAGLGSGTPIALNCPYNRVLTGIEGFWGDSEFGAGLPLVNQIEIVCR